jgi:5-methylcytosine-specific restriction endonuclease McrA
MPTPGVTTRRTYAYRLLCARVRREEQTCWLCSEPIDMQATPRTPRSWSLDHVIALNQGGAPLDRGNARAAHYGCNAARGDRPPARPAPSSDLITSRDW